MFKQLETQLQQWDNRRQTALFLVWIPRGLLIGLLTAVVIAALARWRPLLDNQQLGIIALALGVIGLLMGTAVVFLFHRYTLAQTAQFADRTFGLQERCTTAVELHHGHIQTEPELAQLQLSDTLRLASQVNPAAQLPYQLRTTEWLAILAAILLLVTAVVLPNPQATILQGQRAVTQAIEEQIETIEALEQAIANNPDLSTAEQEALLEPLQDAREQLEAGDMSQEEALATLTTAEQALRELAAENDTTAVREQLQNAGNTLANSENGQSLGEAMQTGDFQQASNAAQELAAQLPTLTPEQQATLASELTETAGALSNTDPQLAENLAAAAEALREGDTAAAQEALQAASDTLSERATQQATAEQATAAANELGQGRQEVAQAGQEGQNSQPSDQQGQEGQAQQGENGEGQQQGQNGSVQALDGSSQNGQQTGQGQNGSPLSGTGEGQTQSGTTSGGTGEGGGSAESVFAPEFVDLSGEPGVDLELPAECVFDPASCGLLLEQTPTEFGSENSQVPYTEVLGQYQEAAYDALDEDYIPLGLRRYIRDYFSSLDP